MTTSTDEQINEGTVKQLELLLEDAKKGKLSSLLLVSKPNSEQDSFFLEEAIKALNWPDGDAHQVLRVISAARATASESRAASLTGDYSQMPYSLNTLVACFPV